MAFGRDRNRSYLTLALERFQGPLLRYVARILKDEERVRRGSGRIRATSFRLGTCSGAWNSAAFLTERLTWEFYRRIAARALGRLLFLVIFGSWSQRATAGTDGIPTGPRTLTGVGQVAALPGPSPRRIQ